MHNELLHVPYNIYDRYVYLLLPGGREQEGGVVSKGESARGGEGKREREKEGGSEGREGGEKWFKGREEREDGERKGGGGD